MFEGARASRLRLTQRLSWHQAIRLIIAVTASLVIELPLFTHSGWPFSHDGERAATRMGLVFTHWLMGQMIPVWATTPALGYGSPSPTLYHKAFTYASAAFYGIFGNVKEALAATLLVFLVTGCLGMMACVRAVQGSASLVLESFAGVMLVSCNYATTDWLVRGADAEFAAMMVAPWLLSWCLILVCEGRWARRIGPLFALEALCHSAIALFFVLPLVLSIGLAWCHRRKPLGAWLRPSLTSVVTCLVLLLPFALPCAALLYYPRVADFLQLGYTPRTSHLAFTRLLWDDQWRWGGREWGGFSPQLDTGLLVAFTVLCPMLCLSRLWTGDAGDRVRISGTLMVLLVIVMLWMQTRSAFFMYDWLPGARFIQFSFRLLLFVSIGLVLAAACLLAWVQGKGHPRLAACLAGVLVASTITNKPWFTGLPRPWFDEAEFSRSAFRAHDSDPVEYFPKTDVIGAEEAVQAMRDLPVHLTDKCVAEPARMPNRELSKVRLIVNCSSNGTVALPIFLVRGLRVRVDDTKLRPHRTCSDPRALLDLPEGRHEIAVLFPTWSSVVGDFFMNLQDFDPRCKV